MPWLTAPFAELAEQDLIELITSAATEGKDLEFKLALPGNADAEKKEFLADVSSFANTSGGTLLFGAREESGILVELPGLTVDNADAEVLRLENIVRTGIQPRISGVAIRALSLASGSVAIAIRIPRSWSAPHMVTHSGSSRFYGRNSAGKYPLDVAELRAAFLLGETTSDRIRSFRLDRIAKLKAEETPIRLNDGPRVVLHLVPVIAFDSRTRVDTSTLDRATPGFEPMYSSRSDYHHNFDGVVVYPDRGEGKPVRTYLQIFRNGILEAASASLVSPDQDGMFIRSVVVEPEIMESVAKYIRLQQSFGIEPPYIVMLTFLNVRGYRVMPDTFNRHWDSFRLPIDRSDLVMSDVLIDSTTPELSTILRPAFDEFWNAGGWEGSRNYDADGSYRRPRG